MDTVFGLLILAGLGYGAFALVRLAIRTANEHRGLSPEEREHRRQIKAAEKGLRRAEKDHKRTVNAAEKELNAVRSPAAIAGVGGIRLFEDRLQMPDGTFPLSPDVTADVDTAGNFAQKHRSTLTRMGVGTLVAGPLGFMVGMAAKKSTDNDTRELYLMAQSGAWASVAKLSPDAGLKARQLAQQIVVAGRNVEQAKRQRQQAINVATERLRQARANTGAVDEAKRQLADVTRTPLVLPAGS
jgi:hypothetical protein